MFRIASVRRPLICTGRGKLLCIHRKSALHLFNKSKLIVWLVFFYVQRLYYRVQTGINFSLENVNPVHRKQSTTRLRKKHNFFSSSGENNHHALQLGSTGQFSSVRSKWTQKCLLAKPYCSFVSTDVLGRKARVAWVCNKSLMSLKTTV